MAREPSLRQRSDSLAASIRADAPFRRLWRRWRRKGARTALRCPLARFTASRHALTWRYWLKLLRAAAFRWCCMGGSGIHPDDTKAATALNVYKITIGAALIDGFVSGLQEGATLPPDHALRHPKTLWHRTHPPRLFQRVRARISFAGAIGCRPARYGSARYQKRLMIAVAGTPQAPRDALGIAGVTAAASRHRGRTSVVMR